MNPFKVPYTITQNYWNNSSRYASGRHSATDMVPIPKGPEPMYPLLPGKVIDKAKGLVTVNSKLPNDLISFFKSKNLIPKNHTGDVYLKTNYIHCLEVMVNVGATVDTNTPVAKCGNIGLVFSGGVPVPPSEQGKPPYPGLHLHLETVLHPNDTSHPFNLDKDVIGRIDPELLLNYKPMPNQAKIVVSKNSPTVYICYAVPSETHLEERASLEGIVVPNPIPDSDSL